jgi:hypothetical protein
VTVVKPLWHSVYTFRFSIMRLSLIQQRIRRTHLPLGSNEIRLIELPPASDGPEASVSFIYTVIEKAAGTYEALSYTWGQLD